MNKKWTTFFTLIALFVFLIQCTSPVSKPEFDIRHIVVIGVDGMSPNGIRNAYTPNMNRMMKEGAWSLTARAVLPTSSSSNWASMIMGTGPEQHGITSNDWERDDFILPAVVTDTDGHFPTIFSVIQHQKPDAEIGAVYHWGGFGRLFDKKTVTYDVTGKNEDETTQLAANYIQEKKPLFLFIHLDHVDHAGHHDGHGSPAYYESVSKADSLIGVIMQATQNAGIADQTLFLVTADHGGIGDGHGGETLEEIQIPFILYGKSVKKGYRIQQPVYTYDNAATVAFALGLDPLPAWIGRPAKAAFTGFDEPEAAYVTEGLTPPVIYPDKNRVAPAGGLYVDSLPLVKMSVQDSSLSIRYTLDGTVPDQQSQLYDQPFSLNQSTVVMAKSFDQKGAQSQATIGYFRLAGKNSGNGINWKYFEGPKWNYVPALDAMKPVAQGKAFEVRIGSINQRPANFAIQYSGFIKIETPGPYKFYLSSDDGSVLLINDKEVVNNDGDHGVRERSGTVQLEKGYHKFVVNYFNGGGGYWLDVYYKGPGIYKQILPPDILFPSVSGK